MSSDTRECAILSSVYHARACHGHLRPLRAVSSQSARQTVTKCHMLMSHKNIVKNSKKRRLFWSGVAETRWFFSFPSRLHIHAGFLQRAARWRDKTWGNTQVRRAASCFELAEYNQSKVAHRPVSSHQRHLSICDAPALLSRSPTSM